MASNLLLAIGLAAATAFAATQTPDAVTGRTSLVTLLSVGSESVRTTSRVTVRERSVDLFGEATNARGGTFHGLMRAVAGTSWQVVGHAQAANGGVFTIPGVRFPHAGDFELVVVLVAAGADLPSTPLEESVWQSKVLSQSQRVAVTVSAVADTAERMDQHGEPDLTIVSFGNTVLRSDEKTAVPASGSLIVSVRSLPQGSKVWAVRRVPYTDRSVVFGPAVPTGVPDQYAFSVSLEAPGDLQQIHLDLMAFVSDRPIRTGPVSWEAFTQWEVRRSRAVEVIVDARRLRLAAPRLAFAAVTSLGVKSVKRLGNIVSIRNGQRAVAQIEGAYEGDLVYFLTRAEGGRVFRVQGPALKRSVQWDEDEARRQRTEWVLLDLRFDRPATGFEAESETGADDPADSATYEVVTVLSPSPLPNALVDSTFLSTQSVHAVSDVVRVQVEGVEILPRMELAISSVHGATVEGSDELWIGERGPVEIAIPKGRPEGMTVSLVRHKLGASTCSVFEASDRGVTQIVPDVAFNHPTLEEGARYQLTAMVTRGRPASELICEELPRHAVATSGIVKVRYTSRNQSALEGLIGGILGALSLETQASAAPEHQSSNGDGAMTTLGRLIAIGLAIILAGLVAALVKWLIDRRRSRGARYRMDPYFETGVPRFLMGLTLLVLAVILVRRHHLPFLAYVVATVLSLDPATSTHLAVWLIAINVMIGIFTDTAYDYARFYGAKAERESATLFRFIGWGCLGVAAALWLFQGALYFAMLSLNSFGVIPLLGAAAFTLIAAAETVVFFFITKLVLPAMPTPAPGWRA